MALFAPFYNFRGKARNFFVTQRVLWWTAWVLGGNDAQRQSSDASNDPCGRSCQPIFTKYSYVDIQPTNPDFVTSVQCSPRWRRSRPSDREFVISFDNLYYISSVSEFDR
jgi:hypothetical protein